MYTEFPGFIAAGRYYSPLIATYQYRFAFQQRVIQDLYRDKKGVEIKMGYMFQGIAQVTKILMVRAPNLKKQEPNNIQIKSQNGILYFLIYLALLC
jgi:hypothetical protein